jgi:hypothetical protein
MSLLLFLWALVGTDAIYANNVHALVPHIDRSVVDDHVRAARLAATEHGFDVELLLAVAYVESRFEGNAIGRMEDGRRRGGAWIHEHAPGTGPRFCGVMQVGTRHDWKACAALRDLTAGYAAGARLLKDWLKLSRGDVSDALNGYGCGMWGLKNGCKRYANRVLAYRRHIARTSS